MKRDFSVDQDQSLVWESAQWNYRIGSYRTDKLPNRLENFRGISLCPLYSNKQIRKIHSIRKEKANVQNRKSNKESFYR